MKGEIDINKERESLMELDMEAGDIDSFFDE